MPTRRATVGAGISIASAIAFAVLVASCSGGGGGANPGVVQAPQATATPVPTPHGTPTPTPNPTATPTPTPKATGTPTPTPTPTPKPTGTPTPTPTPTATPTPTPKPTASPTPTPTPTASPTGSVSCSTLKAAGLAHVLERMHWMIHRPAGITPRQIGRGPSARVCPAYGRGYASCMSLVRTDISPNTPSGYGPSTLQAAYSLTAASGSDGASQIVAIVDAYDDPTAEADLATYRSTFGLPACTSAGGCFMKVNQTGTTGGYPVQNLNWEGEISLDLDMVSAICPLCKIVLIEANSNSFTDLGTAENTAATTCAANEISNSWSGGEFSSETTFDLTYFHHPGVMMTFASGDDGWPGGYPATSQYVTAVGGTTLVNPGTPSQSETVWGTALGGPKSGTGSACSAFEPQPVWQSSVGAITAVCSGRFANDVAAVADPGTGVAVYDSGNGGWRVFGGTSAATPIIAGVYALAGNGSSITYGSYSYSHTGALNDVTAGANGPCGSTIICNAAHGYDGPTGNGTPNGIGGF